MLWTKISFYLMNLKHVNWDNVVKWLSKRHIGNQYRPRLEPMRPTLVSHRPPQILLYLHPVVKLFRGRAGREDYGRKIATRWCCTTANGSRPRRGGKIKPLWLCEVFLKGLLIRKLPCNWSKTRNNCWNDNFFLRTCMVFYKQIISSSVFFLCCHKSTESRCKKWQLYWIIYFKYIYASYKHKIIYIHDYISHLTTVVLYPYFSKRQLLFKTCGLYMFV